MQCTECPVKDVEGCEEEYKTDKWWDMRKHYRKYHPWVKDPASLFEKDARTSVEFEPATLQALHGTYVDIKDNAGKICGRGTFAYDSETNTLSVSGCKIKGRAL